MTRYIVAPEAAEDIDQLLLHLAKMRPSAWSSKPRVESSPPSTGLPVHQPSDIAAPTSPSPGVYFFLVKPYLIAYQYDRNPILIYGVLHGARDVKRVLRSRDLR